MKKTPISIKCESLIKDVEKIKQDHYDQVKALLPELYKELFATYPKLDQIVFLAYTPGFCDGDPCTFNFDVMVSQSHLSDYGMDDEEDDDYDDEEDGEEKPTKNKLANSDLSDKDADTIQSYLLCLSPVFEQLYEYGTQIIVKREDNELGYSVSDTDYDCGH